MTTIYLHIGAPKTATSTLQAVFAAKSRQLRKQGVLYPSGCRHGDAHHEHERRLNQVPERDQDLEELRAAGGGAQPTLKLEYCRFEDGRITLSHSRFNRLSFKGSRFTTLRAIGCHVDGEINISTKLLSG